ncbi:MAG: hypothetical protein GY772_21700, partial [bacterium]|nr:hypothetical protein [bacterium]
RDSDSDNQTWQFTGITANGVVVTENVTVVRADDAQLVTLSEMVDVTSVTMRVYRADSLYTRIDDLTLTQGVVGNATATTEPTGVTTADTSATAQTLTFHTGNLENPDSSDDDPSLTLGSGASATEISSLNSTSFTIEHLDASGNLVANPVSGELYLVRFTFHGDLFIPDGSTIQVSGRNALSIVVENNAQLGTGLSFD